ncbi:integrase arm-type DNA-binding domain-containing protein [Bradyrhizobium sp. 180]|uniref:tyrosine-type recombinase/integrase n=1 Tax=Bradyrhizobium sp. 180 TaxID=2782650 RepID=UPI001FF79537|nr:integrase arm-type DNA-binding domain-containing protein [Bradyrhizobium sp. 180]MCK1489758.1 integrase arm-type DNA-binding domain-containing protein [Bradyrhizobium sp. 180]
MPKLTDSAIKAAKCPPGKDRIELADSSCPGLYLRVTKNGAKTFAFKYWSPILAKTVTLALGQYDDITLTDAKRKVGDHRKEIARDEDPRARKRAERRKAANAEELSFDQLADQYIEQYAKPNKDSWKNDQHYLKRPRAAWGRLPAATVTDDMAAELLDEVAETAPVSANRTQSVLHKMFSWAKQPGRKLVQTNPLADLDRRGGKEQSRDRVLTDDEVRTLWWGLDHPDLPADREVALALKTILTTMVRPYQAALMECAELIGIDGDDAQYSMPRHRVKKRREVIVPLSDLAVEVIKDAISDDDQTVVFPSKFSDGDVPIARASLSQALAGKKNGKKVGDKTEDRTGIRVFLGLEHFTAHDLRRTAATIARRAGAPRPDVKALLDHVNGDVTDVYDKYDMLPEKRAVVNLLASELRRILGDRPAYGTMRIRTSDHVSSSRRVGGPRAKDGPLC